MKKPVSKITFALAVLTSLAGVAQKPQVIPCNTYEAMEQHFAANPQARIDYEAAQQKLQQEAAANLQAKPAAFEYTIPVVFHILYDCTSIPVTDAQCISALAQVNADFARMSSDTNLIQGPFKSLYIPSDIKLMLAKKDPNGNCISGIVRHYDAKTNWSQQQAQQSFYWPYTWDPTRYLNIYIVSNIVPQGTVTGGGIIVGYTYKPGTWPTGNAHDAVVYRGSFLSGGNPPSARSLTHEVGHWLNLPHTFGNTNNPGVSCGDDGISDTPVTKGNFGGCPVSTTNTSIVCASNVTNYFRNVDNIMNYSDCPRNFTAGQTNVMRAALASSISNRQNLWQSTTLVSTDVNSTGFCAPIADFLTTNCSYTVCAGGSLTFKDYSWNGPLTTYQWAGDNSPVIAAPTSSQTTITFPTAGVTNVTLTVSNSQGSNSMVRSITVVGPNAGIIGPHFESFEAQGLPQDWSLIDMENDNLTWVQTGSVAYDQNYCYYIDGSTQPPEASDMLQMPMMDVKNNPGAIFSFAYAYRQENSSQDDKLKVQGSKDCGGTWQDIVGNLTANVMQAGSGGVSADPFFPTLEQWKVYTISNHPSWANYLNSSSVLVRFNFIEGGNGYGNNVFIDAINFWTPVGINELTKSVSFSVYPNPSSGETNVRFTLNDASSVKISIMDILGKEIVNVADSQFAPGEQNVQINADNSLPNGVYFVNLSINGATMSSKLIIN